MHYLFSQYKEDIINPKKELSIHASKKNARMIYKLYKPYKPVPPCTLPQCIRNTSHFDSLEKQCCSFGRFSCRNSTDDQIIQYIIKFPKYLILIFQIHSRISLHGSSSITTHKASSPLYFPPSISPSPEFFALLLKRTAHDVSHWRALGTFFQFPALVAYH